MDLLATQWMIGLLGFAAGITVGALIYHFTRTDAGAGSHVAEELEQLRAENEEYQRNVARHFQRTAELVNNLTESYRDVHQHLSQGAQSLCSEDEALRAQLEGSLANRLISQPEPTPAEAEKILDKAVEPPKDYAPKSAPDERGTLSEEYGLKKKKSKPAAG